MDRRKKSITNYAAARYPLNANSFPLTGQDSTDDNKALTRMLRICDGCFGSLHVAV